MTGWPRALARRRAARAAAAETGRLLAFFETGHLPPHLAAASRPSGDLAFDMAALLGHGPEVHHGLRLLLAAKDCFVRAAVDAARAGNEGR